MADLSQEEWSKKLAEDDNAIIIDVRTDEEIEEGYIPNALAMDIRNPSAFMESAQKLNTSKNYYVYCRSGARSGNACSIMNRLGFENAYNLMGGILDWEGEIVE